MNELQECIDKAIDALRKGLDEAEQAMGDPEISHGLWDAAMEQFVFAIAPEIADEIRERESRLTFWRA